VVFEFHAACKVQVERFYHLVARFFYVEIINVIGKLLVGHMIYRLLLAFMNSYVLVGCVLLRIIRLFLFSLRDSSWSTINRA
jgi:hypothetical protein